MLTREFARGAGGTAVPKLTASGDLCISTPSQCTFLIHSDPVAVEMMIVKQQPDGMSHRGAGPTHPPPLDPHHPYKEPWGVLSVSP